MLSDEEKDAAMDGSEEDEKRPWSGVLMWLVLLLLLDSIMRLDEYDLARQCMQSEVLPSMVYRIDVAATGELVGVHLRAGRCDM